MHPPPNRIARPGLAAIVLRSALFALLAAVPAAAQNISWDGATVFRPVLEPPAPPAGRAAMGPAERKLVAEFDADKNGWLNGEELLRAIEFAGRGRGGAPGRSNRPAPLPGIPLTPADVKNFPNAPLYDPTVLRTFFIDFASRSWEADLVALNNTDVDIAATVTVDGKVYKDVGVHFRGNSSFGVGNGFKRSLNLTFDFVHPGQSIGGYRTLNFLNSNVDPTFMRSVLYMHIARQYLPAPQGNHVQVVINGENWGVYANLQQFNKDFVNDWFKTTKGARWKVGASAGRGGIGGFNYAGDDPAAYKQVFQIKTKDDPEDWAALVKLTKTLVETAAEKLEAALAPMLDVDGALRFLAVDNALMSQDGFWTRASDYTLYRDTKGVFHIVPHDANETFLPGGAQRGGTGGPAALSPLVNANDAMKPLASKLLAVPELRTRYLGYVRDIAEKWLDWKTLGPIVQQRQSVIADEVARDTRKLFRTEDFTRGVADEPAPGTGTMPLRTFADARRTFLLDWLKENEAKP